MVGDADGVGVGDGDTSGIVGDTDGDASGDGDVVGVGDAVGVGVGDVVGVVVCPGDVLLPRTLFASWSSLLRIVTVAMPVVGKLICFWNCSTAVADAGV